MTEKMYDKYMAELQQERDNGELTEEQYKIAVKELNWDFIQANAEAAF